MTISLRFASARWRVGLCVLFFASFGGIVAMAQCLQQVHVAPVIASSYSSEKPSSPLRLGNRPMRKDVNLVLVPTTVIDSFNRPVKSLRIHDFIVYDGDEPQVIKYFNEEDAPISIGILLDTSGSMKKKYELARQAVTQLFANANSEDDYFVITFSEQPELLADTTKSIETIEAELANVQPSGGTPLLDAIYLGLDKLKDARYQRRALVIISDGGDNSSRYRTREIRALAQESDVQIYAMGIFSPLTISIEDHLGKKLLTEITDATGGRAVFLSSAARLPEVSAEFSRELRNQYVLGYQPSHLQADGKLHKIKVKLATRLAQPLNLYYKREYVASK